MNPSLWASPKPPVVACRAKPDKLLDEAVIVKTPVGRIVKPFDTGSVLIWKLLRCNFDCRSMRTLRWKVLEVPVRALMKRSKNRPVNRDCFGDAQRVQR
jgi:hypothetical protein